MIPIGDGAGPEPTPITPEMAKFKPILLFCTAAYIAAIVVGMVGNQYQNAIYYIIMVGILIMMILRADECLTKCAPSLLMLAAFFLFFDIVTLLQALFLPPGPSNFFATSCPETGWGLLKIPGNKALPNFSEFDSANSSGVKVKVYNNTNLTFTVSPCDSTSLIHNVSFLVGIAADIICVFFASKLNKAAYPGQQQEAQQPLNPGGQQARGGAGGGGFGGGGQQLGGGGRGGGAAGAAAMARQQQGFSAFQGQGQALNS